MSSIYRKVILSDNFQLKYYMIVDLHFHSCFSDGTLTPNELLQRAIDAQIDIFSLTDHDTFAGVIELHKANKSLKTRVINGVEISARWKKYDIHVLAYNFDLQNLGMIDLFKNQKENRINRAHEISKNLEKFGIKDAFIKAEKYAQHGNIGRPHFARVMFDEGLVKNSPEAFDVYLGNNKKAYVDSCWVNLLDAVNIVKNAGGDAVIAHPLKYKLTNTKLRKLIVDFKDAGGDGIEVVSSDLQDVDVNRLADLCSDFSLFASSGSDFHGDNISRVGLGLQKSLPKKCIPIWDKWSLNK